MAGVGERGLANAEERGALAEEEAGGAGLGGGRLARPDALCPPPLQPRPHHTVVLVKKRQFSDFFGEIFITLNNRN